MSAEDGPRDDSSSARSDRDDTTSQSNGGEEARRVSGVELRRDRTVLKVSKPKCKHCSTIRGYTHIVARACSQVQRRCLNQGRFLPPTPQARSETIVWRGTPAETPSGGHQTPAGARAKKGSKEAAPSARDWIERINGRHDSRGGEGDSIS